MVSVPEGTLTDILVQCVVFGGGVAPRGITDDSKWVRM